MPAAVMADVAAPAERLSAMGDLIMQLKIIAPLAEIADDLYALGFDHTADQRTRGRTRRANS